MSNLWNANAGPSRGRPLSKEDDPGSTRIHPSESSTSRGLAAIEAQHLRDSRLLAFPGGLEETLNS
jgi:hypothetical protein